MRVLIVEDEGRLAENLAKGLREGAGFAIDLAWDGEEALLLCEVHTYDLIVLDLMLPKLHGREVLMKLRATNVLTPVLVLTAVSDKNSTVELLNRGADDYLQKPFDLGELLARSRALVRRGKGVSQTELRFASLRLNSAEQTVFSGDVLVELSPTEYRILEYLMHRPRAIVSKKELLEHLYDFTWEHHSNVIEAHVSNLRKKLRGAAEPLVLETLRGRGYRLA